MEDKVRMGVTSLLAGILKASSESLTKVSYQLFFDHVVGSIAREIRSLCGIPIGPTRARVTHVRVDRAIAAHKKNDMPFRKAVCFRCDSTSPGCCHTQVDITMDEAMLLAEVIRGGLEIDRDLLALQAMTPDNGDTSPESFQARADDWGKLSFENRRCIFLSLEGKCRVYDSRPFVCRKWYVFDREPKDCDDYKASGPVAAIEGAEIVASASFTLAESGRLPNMVEKALRLAEGFTK